jgi:hypothetical protein
MNIENIAKNALEIIKSKWQLPDKGILAGGSIANIAWELVSGNKAIVNDLDIFLLNNLKEYVEDKNNIRPIFEHKEQETIYREDYIGLCYSTKTNNYYKITEASKDEDDIINLIKYESNTDDPMIVIKSFDINCTQIGYSIDNDRFFWTKEFEEFLQTGDLKVTNLRTPAHTAIRIAKKKRELNANLDFFEFKLIQHALLFPYSDILRTGFKERYYNIYNDNIFLLSKYFTIVRNPEKENFIKIHFKDFSKIWTLKATKNLCPIDSLFDVSKICVFDDENLNNINRADDFLFYMRNIFSKDNLTKKIWSKLSWFFVNNIEYVDLDPSEENLQLISKLSRYAPNTIKNLKGYKISEQITIIKKLLDLYKNDPIIAISVLEKFKIDKSAEIDDQTKLLMELAVRKKIINDTKNKVSKILG